MKNGVFWVVFPVRYELGFYIPANDIFHSDRREILKYPNS
jgi:hypothetical protein